MDWDPLPITISCFNRLNESYQQGLAWQARAEELLAGRGSPTPLATLEKLTNESTRLGCVLPKAKEVRARLAAARALVADIDAALPSCKVVAWVCDNNGTCGKMTATPCVLVFVSQPALIFHIEHLPGATR